MPDEEDREPKRQEGEEPCPRDARGGLNPQMEERVVGQQNPVDDTGLLPERAPAQNGRMKREAPSSRKGLSGHGSNPN